MPTKGDRKKPDALKVPKYTNGQKKGYTVYIANYSLVNFCLKFI